MHGMAARRVSLPSACMLVESRTTVSTISLSRMLSSVLHSWSLFETSPGKAYS